LSDQLEVCQKSLSEYLDTKRCAFPRFYFISDDELLAILGTADPTSVQEHMLKLFDNCAGMSHEGDSKAAFAWAAATAEFLLTTHTICSGLLCLQQMEARVGLCL
jgi:dynein heavy chain